jgi:hypothetical protein
MVAVRQPEHDLLARLAGQRGAGTFEAHVTVEADDLRQRERFRAACADLGVKCVLIELPTGVTRSQPMTSTYHRGDLERVSAEVAELTHALRRRGFPPTRVKLEAVITNAGVPQTDEEVLAFPAANYFEFHLKASLPAAADLAQLRRICGLHAAHLSANALKREEDGRTQRFVTQRAYGVGRMNAEAAFEALQRDLIAAGFVFTNRLREYTIFDSNVAVDAGWIDVPAALRERSRE